MVAFVHVCVLCTRLRKATTPRICVSMIVKVVGKANPVLLHHSSIAIHQLGNKCASVFVV